MIDREHDLSITRQAEVLQISRGSVYYLPRPVPDADLAIMRRLDRLHLEFPFAGSRMLRDLLAAEGCKIGRRHAKTLMRRMGIEALYRRPRTTRPEPGHKIHPYLLRGMEITRPNQVWAMDITYISMASGFVYLAVVLDWATRVFCRGGCRSPWKQPSASRRWRMPWLVTASRTSSTRIRARSSPDRLLPACSPTTASRSAWTDTTAGVPIRVLTAARQIKPTSPHGHSAWQLNPGRGSTYRRGNSVQTTGTSSYRRRATAIRFLPNGGGIVSIARASGTTARS
jgi:hypothetical protein